MIDIHIEPIIAGAIVAIWTSFMIYIFWTDKRDRQAKHSK